MQLDCPLEVAQARERTRDPGAAPRDIYTYAVQPGAAVPGVNVPYERALAPDLTVDTATEDVAAAAERVAALGLGLGPAAQPPEAPGGVVVWITGPPGSGKTALASRLAERLVAEHVLVTVLEWAALRDLVLTGVRDPEWHEEAAHRALAYTAKLLADAGLLVVVDATAPRRAWRALARQLVHHFAEVQLVCPPAVCLDRERAVRWRLQRCAHGGGVLAPPDVAVEYEYSLNPDLVLDTETRSEWMAAEDLLVLARRLLDRAVAR